MAYKFEGSKYQSTEHLRPVEIAKLIRADLTAARASGELPAGIGFSVRCRRVTYSRAIDITIQGAGFRILTARGLGDYSKGGKIRTDHACAIADKVEAIASAYNFDDSDLMTDYFHSRFYLHVDYDRRDTDLERKVAEELLSTNVVPLRKAAR